MPIYEYRCRSGHITQRLKKYSQRSMKETCVCGQKSAIVVSMPARTKYAWGDTEWDGLHDRATGVTYRDKNHRQQVMKSRGLRELAPGEVEAEQRRVTKEHEQHEQNIKTYQATLKETGSAAAAMERTFPNPEID